MWADASNDLLQIFLLAASPVLKKQIFLQLQGSGAILLASSRFVL
jgi:hypothetical protein